MGEGVTSYARIESIFGAVSFEGVDGGSPQLNIYANFRRKPSYKKLSIEYQKKRIDKWFIHTIIKATDLVIGLCRVRGDFMDELRLRILLEALLERFIPIISLRGVGGS
ncbi:19355_t:CDS:2 [Gigaspora margarita]|uniref:19355_t:CDS:1 n=1 Tax=Gigaspora margarita TaxID=4874 RepID=A0ABN7UN15_GIGMA|nr:19355_t:CDS:2 [Gigaspora margarita]